MLVIDGPEGIPALDLAAGDEPWVLLTADGTPCAFVALPSLGPGLNEQIARAVLSPYLDAHRAERRLRAELRRRLGAPEPRRPRPACSVVICTHRRGHLLRDLLDSVQRLDPAPEEVIVVDNDPGGDDCQSEAEGAGARYVREDRRGLNNARRSGLRAARGEVVAFTDDDCIVPPGWLRSLPEHFADPMVAAVTGPAFPHALDHEAQVLRERIAPYLQRLTPRTFDWTTAPVVRTGLVGFGANMILRRSALDEVGEPFPAELDGGTRTRSGGDLYALYRILAAGYRVSYAPDAFVLHRHGLNGHSVGQTVDSWATGFSAFLTRALVLEWELGAIPYSTLSLRVCVRAFLDVAQGTGDLYTARMHGRHLRATLGGPTAWMRALREAARDRSDGPPVALDPASAGDRPRAGAAPSKREAGSASRRTGSASPALSAIVVIASRPERFLSRLEELARGQTLDAPWELIVVSAAALEALPGEPREDEHLPDEVAEGVPVRWVQGWGTWAACANAGAAAARGEVRLFLDEELIWEPGLLAGHLRRHRAAGGQQAVIGYSPVRPRQRGLAALASRLSSEDHFRLTAEAARRTFVEVQASNLSLSPGVLERVGPFDPSFASARTGWEWGVRALRAGVDVLYEPGATATRECSIDTDRYVEEGVAEGRSDALLLARYPELGPALPCPSAARTLAARAAWAAVVSTLRSSRLRRGALTLLRLLEAVRLRRAWLRLATAARRGAYEQGLGSDSRRALNRSRAGARVEVVELDSAEPVPPPRLAAPALVELRLRGRPLARSSPPDGHWHHTALEAPLREAEWARGAAAAVVARSGNASPVDLSGMAVVFGPGRHPGDEGHRRAFEAAGATVAIVEAAPRGGLGRGAGRHHWAELDRALRDVGCEIVGVPLPGVRPEPLWLARASAGLEGDRLAGVIGAAVEPGRPSMPLQLPSPERRWLPYQHGGRPPQFVVVRRALYEELGGFDPAAAPAGPLGPLLDFVERALEAGLVVGYRETPGLTPAGDRGAALNAGRWRRAQARGGLLTRRAIAIGGLRGAAWFAARALLPWSRDLARTLTSRDRRLLNWTAGSAGFLVGSLRMVTNRERGAARSPRPTHASSAASPRR